ncbi:hypothetical protein [Rubinisphaera brasiliensis]|uniref:Uncharacterized protein n=1 Tax=Rubinisphaera brasiliensis (strain ATCC 49424 / DSM 5305 / JCM 21570 / IAM 15109 / NBRC 103401 / IFAM 1448) TaxID=756272 RepID=F0SPG0_RUBBR|nr:hypothetical protein [Rubinisphaera brasiliensis]ADY57864.1 hypothetical protein Plabr_0235 [Rubinisphaera brasiliensis DSM 5305]
MATCIWRGDATPVAQVITRTIGGTWVNGETVTIDINGKEVVATVGDDVTPAEVALLIKEAINGETLTDSTASYTPSTGGSGIPEFAEVTASTSSAALILTAATAGVPFDDPSMSETSTSGTLGTWSTTTSSEGPNDWSTAENWDGDSVPANSDDVFIPAGTSQILYGLDQNSVTLTSLTTEEGAVFGLPEINAAGYDEYRDTYLKISATNVTIGTGRLSNPSRQKLNVGSAQTTVNVNGTGQALTGTGPAFLFLGTHASNAINVLRGVVGIAYQPGESATVATLKVGYISNQSGDATVYCGSGTTLTNVDQSGSNLTVAAATTTVDQTGGTLNILAGAHAAITQDGGVCNYRSTGTITTAIVGNGATLDFSQDMRARTVTNCSVYRGATLRDTFKTVTFTNGIDLQRCGVDDITLEVGSHLTLTPSAI